MKIINYNTLIKTKSSRLELENYNPLDLEDLNFDSNNNREQEFLDDWVDIDSIDKSLNEPEEVKVNKRAVPLTSDQYDEEEDPWV